MSKKIASLQQKDGLWRSNLLDPNHFPDKETSDSSFYVYSLAWGVNEGIQNRSEYQPIIEKGWSGLTQCVNKETGMLGFVQPIGAQPDDTSEFTTMSYGAGAFILAGLEVNKMMNKGQE